MSDMYILHTWFDCDYWLTVYINCVHSRNGVMGMSTSPHLRDWLKKIIHVDNKSRNHALQWCLMRAGAHTTMYATQFSISERKLQAPRSALISGATCGMHMFAGLSFLRTFQVCNTLWHPASQGTKCYWYIYLPFDTELSTRHAEIQLQLRQPRLWPIETLSGFGGEYRSQKGGQKFWLQWQLADTAWLACACVAATQSAGQRPSNEPTQSHSLQRSHPHLNSIFVS